MNHRETKISWVECDECQTQGPVHKTPETAIAAWNRRPAPPPSPSALEALQFYAAEENWIVPISGDYGELDQSFADVDGGDRARRALSAPSSPAPASLEGLEVIHRNSGWIPDLGIKDGMLYARPYPDSLWTPVAEIPFGQAAPAPPPSGLVEAATEFARAWAAWHDNANLMLDDELLDACHGIVEALGLEMVEGEDGIHTLEPLEEAATLPPSPATPTPTVKESLTVAPTPAEAPSLEGEARIYTLPTEYDTLPPGKYLFSEAIGRDDYSGWVWNKTREELAHCSRPGWGLPWYAFGPIAIPESPKASPAPKQAEEGDKCRSEGCGGEYGYKRVMNCYCHRSPPCHYCVEKPLVCLRCGEDPRVDGADHG